MSSPHRASSWTQMKDPDPRRKDFIKQIYFALVIQCSITVTIASVSLASNTLRKWFLANYWFWILNVGIVLLSSLIALFVKNLKQDFPQNIIIFSIFSVSKSFMVVCVTAYFDPLCVFIGVLMEMAVSLGMYGYVYYTHYNFRGIYAILFGTLISSILFALFMGFFGDSRPIKILICFLLSVIFAIYVGIDTELIESGRYSLSSQQYLYGLLCVYIDMIFLPAGYLLSLCNFKT
ncbi:unnamed protein product [Blepharisma stoltei]|uniref:Uncharacterized protein n=1 Tax=Blepharisma stoltei TaxID=1481888 RepID=A0AAU9K8F1_9CILI|nr:unnamed protein product [Blepharisma stoltei]